MLREIVSLENQYLIIDHAFMVAEGYGKKSLKLKKKSYSKQTYLLWFKIIGSGVPQRNL